MYYTYTTKCAIQMHQIGQGIGVLINSGVTRKRCTFYHYVSLNVAERSLKYNNGHLFCKCIAKNAIQEIRDVAFFCKPMVPNGMLELLHQLSQSLCQQVTCSITCACPMCFVVGPFKKDSVTDRAVATLQVDIKTFAVISVMC